MKKEEKKKKILLLTKSGRWRKLLGVRCAGGRGNTTQTPEALTTSNSYLRSLSDEFYIIMLITQSIVLSIPQFQLVPIAQYISAHCTKYFIYM